MAEEITNDTTIAALENITPNEDTTITPEDTTVVEDVNKDTKDSTGEPDTDKTTEKEDKEDEVTTGDVVETPVVDLPESVQIKVNGELVDVKFEDLVKGFNHSEGAAKKMQEANLIQQQTVEFIKMLQSNPAAVLSDPNMGINFREVAEAYLVEQLELEQMPESERELLEANARIKQFEDEQTTLRTQADQDAVAQQTVLIRDEIQSTLEGAEMPVNQYTFQRVAHYMRAGLQLAEPVQLSPSDVIDLVRNDYKAEIKSLFGGSNDESLIDMIGEDGINKIRKFDANRLTNKADTPVKNEDQGAPIERSTDNKKNKKMSTTEWRRSMGF